MKAYIQGDWIATKIIEGDVDAKATYRAKLEILKNIGIENVATWHDQAVGIHNQKKAPDTNVLRNTSEIAQADCVITMVEQLNPEYKHWGSLTLMGYAIGLGKPCYVVSSLDNCIRRSHFSFHPLIKHFETLEQLCEFAKSDIVTDFIDKSSN